ncbi:MAG: hypothetical protein AB7U38_09060 [Hyphomicrobiales bacterium]
MWKTTVLCVSLLFVAGFSAPASVQAKPLGADECKARITEHDELVSKGAASLLDKEPDWVKTNMTEGDLKRIRRLLEVEDDIRFRCIGMEVAGVTPGQLLGKKTDNGDGDDEDKEASADASDKTAKVKPVKANSGPDIPLPLRKPAPPKRAESLRFGNFGQLGQN